VDWDDKPFELIGADFEKTGHVIQGKVGLADVRLFLQRPAVDFGVEWLNKKHYSE
jgi:aminoglycoside 3-N-acetyltransferase